MSARVKAGASLMPSPTIMTDSPLACSLRTMRSLSAGSTPAVTASAGNPTALATARAVRSLSPVTIRTLMPRSRNAFTAARLSGFTRSANAKIPAVFPSIRMTSAVLPSSPKTAIRFSTLTLSDPDKSDAFPTATKCPFTTASTRPGVCRKPEAAGSVNFSASAARTTACASGCSLSFSTAPAAVRSSAVE